MTLKELDDNLKRTQDSLQQKVLRLEEKSLPHIDFAGIRRNEDSTVPDSKPINLFIEMGSDPNKQFYRTTSVNRELFSQVKRLPQIEVKRILITGGAGFIGECP